MSFFCAHLDPKTEQCMKLKVECIPGRRGCVLRGKVKFLIDPDERVAQRDPVRKKRTTATASRPSS